MGEPGRRCSVPFLSKKLLPVRTDGGTRNRGHHRRGLVGRNLALEPLEPRQLLAVGPELLAMDANPGEAFGLDELRDGNLDQLTSPPTELTFDFGEGHEIDTATIESGIRITRAGFDRSFGQSNDRLVFPGHPLDANSPFPGYFGVDPDAPHVVIVRFAETLPDDLYQIDLIGLGTGPLADVYGDTFGLDGVNQNFSFQLDLELGPQVVSVVPEPISRQPDGSLAQARDTILVYFNEDDDNFAPGVAENPNFYQLIFTDDTATTADDQRVLPVTVDYNPDTDIATLVFADDLDKLAIGSGTYRLRIGTDESLPAAPFVLDMRNDTDPGSAFATAFDLGSLASDLNVQPILTSGEIEPQHYGLDLAGSNNDLGHGPNSHISGPSDQVPGVTSLAYNFRPVIGERFNGAPAFNLITTPQKQRVREAFDLWEHYLGVSFFETAEGGFTIATGELETIDQLVPSGVGDQGGLGDLSLAGIVDDPVLGSVPTAIMDAAEPWNNEFGVSENADTEPSFFLETMKQIGVLLGLTELPATDVEFPPLTVMQEYPTPLMQPPATDELFGNVPYPVEPVFPGDHDIVHGRHLYRPDGRDIDVYSFQLDRPGNLTLEVFAERLTNSSLLDSVLTLYRFDTQTDRYQILSRNDDYFSEDSFVELAVGPGQYMVAVTSTGNTDFDPTIEDTGSGGTTEGRYDLRFDFRPELGPDQVLRDTAGSAFDGDLDGASGGVFNFWSRAEGDTRALFLRGGAEMFEDGQQFTLTNLAGWSETFEFYDGVTYTGLATPITFVGSEDLDTMAGRIAFAIESNPGLSVTTTIDGNRIELDGERRVEIDPEFGGMGSRGRSYYVDKAALDGGDGSLDAPFRYIDDALAAAEFGDVVRVVANGGRIHAEDDEFGDPLPLGDGDMLTPADNLAYEIGFDVSDRTPRPLQDGTTMDIPAGVTVQIDPGAIFKLRRSSISVGTNSAIVKRNAAALQVFGTPRVLDSTGDVIRDVNGQPVPGSVLFTSYDDQKNGEDTNPLIDQQFPSSGDWGGLVFRNDLDHDAERFTWDSQAIFLNYVNHADIRYGGGFVEVGSIPTVNDSIHMRDARPTVTFNTITESAHAAMSGNPDSFREDTFHAPEFQRNGPFTSDVRRIGPHIRGNSLTAYRDDGAWGAEWHTNRFNSLFISTQTYPGHAAEEMTVSTRWDDMDIVHQVSQQLIIAGTPGGPTGEVKPGIDEPSGVEDYTLTARQDAGLVIDPGVVVKLVGPRIEVTFGALIETAFGAQLIAEGLEDQPVVFTSAYDDRYGAGGIFDTTDDGDSRTPIPGDWGGILFMHLSRGSIDRATIAFGGGEAVIKGHTPALNAIEIHQADVRVARSRFYENADGHGENGDSDRIDHEPNRPGTIFVRGAQPVIVQNVFQNNLGPAINVNANALNADLVPERGRSRGEIDLIEDAAGNALEQGNQGPLIAENRFGQYDPDSLSPFTGLPANGGQINGMEIRPHTLTTESVWDDTGIAHILRGEIYIPNFHSFGGLRLESDAQGSLVVKLQGENAGITAGGELSKAADRIGGRLQIVGHGDRPVVFTSLHDDSVGAGLDPQGRPVTDTNGNGDATTAAPGDWRSVRIQQYAHDRNVAVYTELESSTEDPPSADNPTGNSTPEHSEYVGVLAASEKAGDDNERLGFEIHGLINHPSDVDVYRFEAAEGTEFWLDIDRTSSGFDPVVEILDSSGLVFARSDNSLAEDAGSESLFVLPGPPAYTLRKSPLEIPDRYSTNPLDAGLRVVLPAALPGGSDEYHIRVRSSARELLSDTPDLDADLFGGLTSGVYQLQIRLREVDETPGSAVSFADIRFATDGIEVIGQPANSPLSGETAEGSTPNNTFDDAQPIGNPGSFDRAAISVSGWLDIEPDPDNPGSFFTELDYQDVDWYRVELGGSIVIDQDYGDSSSRPDISLWLFDRDGRLIAAANQSHVQDDMFSGVTGGPFEDLSRGSVGIADAFLGPIDLEPGEYYLAVTPDFRSPAELKSAGYTREPLDSIGRVVEDHVEWFTYIPQFTNDTVPDWLTTGNSPVLAGQGVSTWGFPQNVPGGEFQPFLDANSPVPNPQGGDNLWHFSSWSGDPDYVNEIPPTGSRNAFVGGSFFAPDTSYHFGLPGGQDLPSGAHGSLVSNEFSLAGYSAADLPTLYFSYYLDPGTADTFRVYGAADGGNWVLLGAPADTHFVYRPFRADLGQFAGHSSVRIRFEYDSPSGSDTTSAAGLYLDDIIVGFAERGEMFVGTDPNTDFEEPPASRPVDFRNGGYQLEIRPASKYMNRGEHVPLFRTFDTNDRHRDSVVLDVPEGADLVDGQTIVLSGGGDEQTLTFHEVSLTSIAPGHDTITEALPSGIQAGQEAIFWATGEIGDNPEMAQPAAEVDFVTLDLQAGAILFVDLDTQTVGSQLDAGLTLFFDDGFNIQQIAFNNEGQAPNEFPSADPYLTVQAPVTGTYYLGISGDHNFGYDPEVEGSGVAGSTGSYELEILVGARGGLAPTDIPFAVEDAAWKVARRVVPAINDTPVQPALDIEATLSDGAYSLWLQLSTSAQVNLYGELMHVAGVPHTVFHSTGDPTDPDNPIIDGERTEIGGMYGDANRSRQQGQIVLMGNRITDSAGHGIVVAAGPRSGPDDSVPQPGPVRSFPVANRGDLVTGVTITNNLVAFNVAGGILLDGDPNLGTGPTASVPIGRVVNNTLYGFGGGNYGGSRDYGELDDVGLHVTEHSTADLLNNIVANFAMGMMLPDDGADIVRGGSVYRGNLEHVTDPLGDPLPLGAFDIDLDAEANQTLFVDPDHDNFYLDAGSLAVDSAIDSVEERFDLAEVKRPLGLAPSIVVAPRTDLAGLERQPIPGVGSIDRGALERLDETGPTAALELPEDNDVAGVDLDPLVNTVEVAAQDLGPIVIRLEDTAVDVDPLGVDDHSVQPEAVVLTRGGQPLEEGLDYFFDYDANDDRITLQPLDGAWLPGEYVVTIASTPGESPVADLAGNPVQANSGDGQTQFVIRLTTGSDFGDAPDGAEFEVSYNTFAANNGASHDVFDGFRLGDTIDSEIDGQPDYSAGGDGDDEDGVTLPLSVYATSTFTVPVDVTIPPQIGDTAWLDGWIDFDRDGVWEEGEEHVVHQEVTTGENLFDVTVPATVSWGRTFMRLRLSTSETMEPTGAGGLGEVEDYQLVVWNVPSRFDLTLNLDPTAVAQPTGEVAQLPASREWLDEWDSYWVEIWVSTQIPHVVGVTSASVDLSYNTQYHTATLVEYGPGFSPGGEEYTIDDLGGVVRNIQGVTSTDDVGDGAYALFARVAFERKPQDDGVPHNGLGQYLTPISDLPFELTRADADLVGDTPDLPSEIGDPATVDLWPVMYDLDDDDSVNFSDFAHFAAVFLKFVGDTEETWASDFDRSGRINFADFAFFTPNFLVNAGDGKRMTYAPGFPELWNDTLLKAAVPAQREDEAPGLTEKQLMPLVTEAVAQMETANDDDDLVARLGSVTFEIVDLPGTVLGQAVDGKILIDSNAAGHGWWVSQELRAESGDPDSGQAYASPTIPHSDSRFSHSMDLLTVVMHELGHIVGRGHTSDGGLMDETLPLGTRRPWDAVDGAFDEDFDPWKTAVDAFFGNP